MVRTDGIVVNTLTGITGAGRAPTDTNVFTNIDSNAEAYGLLGHRHTPEIEQELDAQVVFTPHLVPMSRGLLATCYARPADDADLSTDTLVAHLRQRWADEPFVVATEGSPSTKATLGSNTVHVTARYDDRTNTVIAIAALDNLTKGASGGAVQAANVALGLDETAGLPLVGVGP
jgi:N-acetyl-gamma-glutamyl-phosphate reductase